MDTLFCLLLSFFLFLFFTDEEEELHLHHNDRETEGTKNLRKNGKTKKYKYELLSDIIDILF